MKNKLGVISLFFSILLLPLGMGAIYYSQSLSIIQRNFEETTTLHLRSKIDLFEQMLKEIESIREMVVQDPDILIYQKKSTGRPFTGTNTASILEIQRDLVNISTINKLVINYYLSFPFSDTVISPQGSYNITRFFGGVLQARERKIDLQAFFEQEDKNRYFLPNMEIIIDEKEYSAIVYVSNMGFPHVRGYFILLINAEEIEVLFQDLLPQKDCGVQLSINGEALYSVGQTDKKEGMIFKYKTDTLGLEGTLFISSSHIQSILRPLRYLNLAIFSFFLILAIVMAIMLAKRSRKPVDQLTVYVKKMLNQEGSGEEGGITYLRNNIQSLFEREKVLSKQLDSQRPYLIQDLLNVLLTGAYSQMEDIEQRAHSLDLNIRGTGYGIIVLKDQDLLLHSQLNHAILERLLIEISPHLQGHLLRKKSGLITLFLFFTCENKESILNKLTDSIERVFLENNIRLRGGVGHIYDELSQVSLSMNEAEKALEQGTARDKAGFFYFSHEGESDHIYLYQENQENRLISHILEGKKDNALDLLSSIYRSNLLDKQLSGEFMLLLFAQIQGSLIRDISGKLDEAEERSLFIKRMKRIQLCQDSQEIYDLLKAEIESLSLLFQSRLDLDSNRLSLKIREFIDGHYTDRMMGLDMIASHFSLSPVHISSIFKEQTGLNCSSLIEEKRIDKSIDLLNLNYSVKETANMVGYGSSGTFIRAFKRKKGVTPTQYERQK